MGTNKKGYDVQYQREKLHRVPVTFQLWEYEIVHDYCVRHNIKLATLIKQLVREKISEDTE